MALERLPFHEACSRVKEYQGGSRIIRIQGKQLAGKPPDWPDGTGPLLDPHKQYLKRRRFDPDFLEQKYGLRATGWTGDYAYRIIAPIYYQGVIVSYQGRDWTEKAEKRYKACPIPQEMVHHKDILYNLDNCQREIGLVVEGITDVWRLGDDVCATFGTKWTIAQANILVERFSRVIVLFDPEQEAQMHAKALANILSGRGVTATNLRLHVDIDPGEFTPEYVEKLRKEWL